MKNTMKWCMALATLALCACGQQNHSSEDASKQEAAAATVQTNQVEDVIMARRSIRKYKRMTVEDEKMQQIIQCGINAPNGKRLESWEVRIVNTPELMEEINQGYNQFLKKLNRREQHVSYGAPVLIFIAYDKSYDLSQVDCGLLGENMILTAQSLGLGTCCLGGIARFMNSPEGAELLKRLDFSDSHELLYAISLGYPDEQPAAKPRTLEKVRYIK